MQNYKDLKVWQRAHELVLRLYGVTRTYPSDERFGLVSQLRRAGVSVAANLVEGSGRRTNTQFARFTEISYASAAEVEYLLLLSRDLSYLEEARHRQLEDNIGEIKRMLAGLLKKLTTDN